MACIENFNNSHAILMVILKNNSHFLQVYSIYYANLITSKFAKKFLSVNKIHILKCSTVNPNVYSIGHVWERLDQAVCQTKLTNS